jgi:predicted small lipoprotein YifL
MKRFVVMLLCALMLASLTGCGLSSSGSNTKAPDQTVQKAATEAPKQAEVEVKILSSKLGKDYDDKPIIILNLQFTNKSDKADSFDMMVDETAYQAGVECEGFVIMASGKELNDKSDAKVQPNVPLTFEIAYKLNNTNDPVQIVFKEMFAFGEANVYLDQTINIK